MRQVKRESGDSTEATETFSYPGRELEAMHGASNYHRWILQIFKPFLGQHLVEVGAGVGSFSQLILESHACQTLSLIEPSGEMFEQLSNYSRSLKTTTAVDTFHGTLSQAAPLIEAKQKPDSIIYVNVLEHISDDDFELNTIRESLAAEGRLFLFVPALTWLYGPFDERVGHFRRYSKRELTEKLNRSGFEVMLMKYFDLSGIAPWWIKYRLFKSANMEPAAVKLYDRLVVPAARLLESLVTPPIGKNIIAIAQKS